MEFKASLIAFKLALGRGICFIVIFLKDTNYELARSNDEYGQWIITSISICLMHALESDNMFW